MFLKFKTIDFIGINFDILNIPVYLSSILLFNFIFQLTEHVGKFSYINVHMLCI